MDLWPFAVFADSASKRLFPFQIQCISGSQGYFSGSKCCCSLSYKIGPESWLIIVGLLLSAGLLANFCFVFKRGKKKKTALFVPEELNTEARELLFKKLCLLIANQTLHTLDLIVSHRDAKKTTFFPLTCLHKNYFGVNGVL